MITKEYERTAARLLRGMPKSKPYFKLIDGIRLYRYTHKTKQAVKWQRFWQLKSFTRGKSF